MTNNDPILPISVAAKLLGLHPRTLMLYEKEGLIEPYRTDTMRRMYSKKDLEQLQFVKYLTHTEGINIKGTQTILKAIRLADREGFLIKAKLFPDFKLKELI